MKATRKLIPALAMLVVAAVVMSSASFAWFTMSREVTAKGMNVTVTAPNNLQIKGIANTDVATTTDTDFGAVGTTTAETALLVVPASSADGANFFIQDPNNGFVNTENTAASIKEGSLNKDNSVLIAGSKANKTTVGAYVDFKYQVQTTGDKDVDVAVKSVTVTKNGTTALDAGVKAVRAAIVPKPDNSENVVVYDNTTFTDATALGHDYFADTAKAVSATKAKGADATLTAVNLATIGSTTLTDASDKVFTVAGNTTGTPTPKDITIRVWLEGESINCTTANAAALNFSISVVLRDCTFLG